VSNVRGFVVHRAPAAALVAARLPTPARGSQPLGIPLKPDPRPVPDGVFTFSDFSATEKIFAELGFDGGGYAWHGALDALLRTRDPALLQKLSFDPEASELVVTSDAEGALTRLERWVHKLQQEPALLRRTLRRVDRSLMG
jgi:Immunity protein 51